LKVNSCSDLRNKVAELIIIRASSYGLDSLRKYPQWELPNKDLKRLLEQGVGGVILYGGSIQDVKTRSKQLQTWSNKTILLCADVEEGVGQRFDGGTWFVPPMALGLIYEKDPEQAIVLAEEYGRSLGEQARLSGINWVLAPVCDINTNPKNPVINMRAWGENPDSVSNLVCAFNKGLISQGVLSCAKHFPGHGDTGIDSHLSLPILEHDLLRLEEKELVPFKALIQENVNSIMTAHILLKKIDPDLPATLSSEVIYKLLRQKMKYKGLIVTDALVMQAISTRYSVGEASVMAIEAGVDLIMMPENADEAINAILNALINGRITMDRLQNSLDRREKELSKLNRFKSNKVTDSVDLNSLEAEHTKALSKRLINLSIKTNNVYLKNDFKGGINLIKVDKLISNRFLNDFSPALNIPERFGFRNIVTHSLGFPIFKNNKKDPLNLDIFGEKKFILQLFIRGNPFIGEIDSPDLWISIVKQLQRNQCLLALFVYGSIYSWKNIIDVLEPSIPAFYSPGQMPLAQKDALERLFTFKHLETENKYISKSKNEFTN